MRVKPRSVAIFQTYLHSVDIVGGDDQKYVSAAVCCLWNYSPVQ